MDGKHTPTPWSVTQAGHIVGSDKKRAIHSVIDDVAIGKEDAAFIVRAVNAHDDLLSIVKRELEMEGSVSFLEMEAAIAKAEAPNA